ncbi:MAG: DUF4202 domain-containing protein [Paracoccaceae bacterium]
MNGTNDRLARTLALIDAANGADPKSEDGRPAALLYGERMSAELARLCPAASDILQIAARGQHIERWLLPRNAYPEGREGYHAWRREQGRRHGERVGAIMREAGYGAEAAARVGTLLRKEGIKRDGDVQMLEDVICFVFLRWYFGPFAEGRKPEELRDIVAKTARKMSADARARALDEFDLPDDLASAVRG